jgi:hypothetical protein
LNRLFDAHYQEQVHLIDALILEANSSGDGAGVLAGDCLGRSQFAYGLYGRASPVHLLLVLMDAHAALEEFLRRETGARAAVESEVFLANQRQMHAIEDELSSRQRLVKAGRPLSMEARSHE